MDDSVRRAMQIWPNVPECYGWLRLDRRGNWLLTHGEGSVGLGRRISNPKVCDFIARNYIRAANGSYFFQNGPQRVHVELAYTPFILSVINPDADELTLANQLGEKVSVILRAWIDEQGALLLEVSDGVALVDDRDTEQLLACVVNGSGEPLTEAQLLTAVEQLMMGQNADVRFQCAGSDCAIQPVNSSAIEQLGFVQEAKPLAS